MDNYFEKYLESKNSIEFLYKQHRLSSILATDILYAYAEGVDKKKFSKALRWTLKMPDAEYFKELFTSGYVIITYSVIKNRPEYSVLMDRYSEICSFDHVPMDYKYKLRRRFSFKHVLVSAFQVMKIRLFGGNEFRLRLYLFFRLVWYKNYIDALLKSSRAINVQACILFDSSTREDAIIAEFFRIFGVPTISAQHGLFMHHTDSTGVPAVSSIMGENVNADYFLAWGDQTVDVVSRYNEKCQVLKVGNPYVKEFLPKVSGPLGSILVFLARPEYKDGNIKLLSITKNANRYLHSKILIKLHPRDKESNYSEFEDKYLQLIPKGTSIEQVLTTNVISLGIVYNSSTVADLPPWGVFTCTFDSKEPFIIKGKYSFTDVNSLRSLMLKHLSGQGGSFETKSDFIVPCSLTYGAYRSMLENYRGRSPSTAKSF